MNWDAFWSGLLGTAVPVFAVSVLMLYLTHRSLARSLRVVALCLGAVSFLGAVGSALWVLLSYGQPVTDDNYAPVFWAFVLVALGAITAFSAWKRRPEPA